MPIRGIAIRTTSLSLLSADASDVHLVRRESGLGSMGPILNVSLRCRGLKVLVDLLDEDYLEQADLVAHALVGVGSVFELQASVSHSCVLQ